MCQLVLPGMRAPGRRPDRERELDGRQAHLSGRGHLPRHQVRGGGDLRRHALRGPGLRDRRGGDRARPDQDELRRDRGGFGFRTRTARTPSSTPPYPRLPRVPTKARWAGSAAGPEAVAKAIEKALTAKRPRTRYPVTASARVLMTQRKLLPDRAWDAVVASSFPRPGRRLGSPRALLQGRRRGLRLHRQALRGSGRGRRDGAQVQQGEHDRPVPVSRARVADHRQAARRRGRPGGLRRTRPWSPRS